VERNLHRYIVKRSLRAQLILIGISFVLGLGLNPLMLDLQKRIINQAIGRRNFEALLWLCGGFLGAVILNGALKYVKQNMEGTSRRRCSETSGASSTTGSCASRSCT
jgi:hypothetical protein